jgi:hypothetical protein
MSIENWLTSLLQSEAPDDDIIAYYFGIFETPEGYSIYLTGSAEYDADDDDWATNTDFEPEDNYCTLPEAYKEMDWEEVQDKIVTLLKDFTATAAFNHSYLAKARAIAAGFDDGDLVLIR